MQQITRLTRCALFVFLCAAVAFGQRGKIAGRVTDAETKENLFGVNVLLQGTAQGASTDLDGYFVVQNVPPGTYTILASMIGYNQIQLKNVAVSIDHTTDIAFSLRPSTVQMNTVVVEARQPAVVKDRTSSATLIEGRDVQNAPIEGLREVMDLNAGMQRRPDGTFSLRGSGGYDMIVTVNGVEQMTSNTGIPGFSMIGDKGNNSWKYDFNPLGVQQMEILSGGFNAEYGNAQAGVVKVVTKEGGPVLSGQVRYEIRPPGQYHWGKYIYDEDPATTIEWQKWGTIDGWRNNPGMDSVTIYNTYLKDAASGVVKDSLNGHAVTVDEWRRMMLDQWILNHTASDDNQLGAYDYRKGLYQRFLFSIGGPLGKNSDILKFFLTGEYRSAPTRIPTAEKIQTYQNYSGTVIYHPAQTSKFRFTGIYQSYRGGVSSGAEDIRWAGPDGSNKYYLVTSSPREEYTTTQSLNWTYTIDPRSFFDLLATHQYEKYVLLEQPVPQRAATWRDNVFRGQWYQFAGAWDEGYRAIYSFTTFSQQDLRTHQYNFTIDYSNQLTQHHDVKAGIRGTYWDMLNSGVYSSFASNAYITRTGYAEYYRAYPFYLAAYAQDKMEFEGMVANIGIRFDGYDFNMPMPENRFNPFYIAEGSAAIGDPSTAMPSSHYTISPRFGLSFPIGEQTAFRLQYGHFSSMPVFKQAYTSTNELGWAAYGNPDLGPKKTINYEFGIQHSFAGTHRLDLVAYYNDRTSQIDNIRIHAASGDIRHYKNYYSSYANNQFGASKGLEATFEKIGVSRWIYRFTYSLSRTTFGRYGPTELYSDDPNDIRNTQNVAAPVDYLSYDDRTHSLRMLVTYNVEKDGGIDLLGIKPFAAMSASLIYTAQSGAPFTYVPMYDPLFAAYSRGEVTNNRRYPLEAKIDLNLNKNITLFGFDAIIAVRIMNLFDNKWLTPPESSALLQDWVENGITADNPVTIMNAVPDYSKDTYKFNFYRVYRNVPRQIYFTLGFSF